MNRSAPTLIASSRDAELYEYPDGSWVVKARVGDRFVVDSLWADTPDPRDAPDSRESLLGLADEGYRRAVAW